MTHFCFPLFKCIYIYIFFNYVSFLFPFHYFPFVRFRYIHIHLSFRSYVFFLSEILNFDLIFCFLYSCKAEMNKRNSIDIMIYDLKLGYCISEARCCINVAWGLESVSERSVHRRFQISPSRDLDSGSRRHSVMKNYRQSVRFAPK